MDLGDSLGSSQESVPRLPDTAPPLFLLPLLLPHPSKKHFGFHSHLLTVSPNGLVEPCLPNVKCTDVLVTSFARKNLRDKDVGSLGIRWILKGDVLSRYLLCNLFLSSVHKE